MKTTLTNALALALACAGLALSPAASAVKFGADQRITTVANMGAGEGSSQMPRLAAFGGIVHMTWIEYPCGGFACGELYYVRSTDNGFTWETPQRLTNNSRTDLFPSIAAGSKGVMIAWNNNFDPPGSGIYTIRNTNNGAAGSWQAESQRFIPPSSYSRNPEIIADSAGDFHLTWYDSLNSPNVGHVFYMNSCDGGATWTNTTDLSAYDGQVDSETPQWALDSNGQLWLSFRSTRNGDPQGGWSPYQQYMMRLRAKNCTTGVNQDPKQLFGLPAQKASPGLPDEFTNAYGATFTGGLNGKLHLGYWNNKAGNNLAYRMGNPATGGWRNPTDISLLGFNNAQITAGNSDIAGPGLAEDVTGKVHISWWEESSVNQGFKVGNIKYRESADGGTTWGPVATLSEQATGMTPKMVTHNGRVHVAWADFRPVETTSEIFYKSASIFPKGDTTSDGRADLFWRDSSMGLSWWQMNANTLQNSNFFNVGNEWVVKRVGDMNGDGKADLIWRREGGVADGAAYLWTLNGLAPLGFFDLGILPMSQWDLQGVGDLDGDGRDDIVWRNKLDGSVYVWLMNGGTIIGQATAGTVGLEWVITDVKDMNGDGRADIIFRRTSDGTVFIWFMNGTTLASSGGPGALDPATWDLMGAGDFNGDQKADLLWRNKITGDIWIWLMNGASIISSASIGNPGTSWNIKAIADINGDGRADIILRQGTTSTYAWMMNGFTIIQQGNIANPGGTWQLVGP
jgi:FG-GAP-like repeat